MTLARQLFSLTGLLLAATSVAALEYWTKAYNIGWTNPCTKALDSMPTGGG